MDTTELQNQAIEIRDAENEGENTALRVGTMLLAIIDAFANIVDLDTLQQILEQYASTTGNGQIYWRHSRCVFLASMGADFDAVNGDGWEYTDHNGDIVFNPTSKSLRVVGETGSYFVYANVLYVHAHTSHAYKWDTAEQKMVEVTDTNLPTVITYKNTPPFSQVAIGESYVFQSQSSGPKIAIKISSSETYSFLPDPKKIYAFRDIRQAMLWKPSNQTWVSLTPRVINDLTTGGEGDALSAEMGKKIRQNITILLSRLGNYAFPNGKPTLDWGDGGGGGGDDPAVPTYSVQKTIGTGISASGGDDDINEGDRLEVSIAITNDLYIIDEDHVEVTMDGSPVDGAFDAATGKITIAEVYGEVVINVPSMTYVGYGETNSPLVLMFDGKHQGSTASQWENLANANKPLVLSGGYTKNTDNVQFGGTDGRGIIQNFGTDLPYNTATLEVVLSFGVLPTSNTYVFGSGNDHNALFYVGENASYSGRRALYAQTTGEHSTESSGIVSGCIDTAANAFLFSANQIISISRQGMRYTLNKTPLSTVSNGRVIVGDSQSTFNAAGYIFVSGCTTRTGAYYAPFTGEMYCIRAYTRALTETEVAQNYKVDQKRFNIA